jgi:predicted flap endonuclease-1-like 5' DNA nuclease
VRNQQSRVELTTLGDMDVFSQLKQQLSQPGAKAPTADTVKAKKEEEVEKTASDAKASEVADETATADTSDVKEKATDAPVMETPEEVKEELVEEAPKVKASKAKPAKAKVSKAKASKASDGDDLKKIEGVGPKSAEILTEAGIATYAKLAESTADRIREILAAAGNRYKSFDPTTWPEQAGLAAEGKWDELKALKEKLDGGRKK